METRQIIAFCLRRLDPSQKNLEARLELAVKDRKLLLLPMKQTKKTEKKRTPRSPAPKPAQRKAPPRAVAPGKKSGDVGLPPAPLEILSEENTKTRLKVIIGDLSGENPAKIKDDSPVRRANILLPGLRSAINRHFFPKPLHGIVGFPKGETVIECAKRIKQTRDPQIRK